MGYTCATKEITIRNIFVKKYIIAKNFRSSDCFLKLENMKLESLVLAHHDGAVNLFMLTDKLPVRRWDGYFWIPLVGVTFVFYFFINVKI